MVTVFFKNGNMVTLDAAEAARRSGMSAAVATLGDTMLECVANDGQKVVAAFRLSEVAGYYEHERNTDLHVQRVG